MKKIGLVGGLGPESTLDYYQGIINAFKSSYEQTGYPEICIESVDLKSFMDLIKSNNWDGIVDVISRRFEALRNSGAHIGAIVSNTPHKVFEQIQQQTKLPLISIIESACDFAVQSNLKSLCLLGTEVTMAGSFYQKVFDRKSITLVVPNQNEQALIQQKLFSEIEFGIITPETRKQFIGIIERIQRDNPLDGLILGCTELPLVIKPEDTTLAYLDTTAIHVSKIVEQSKI